VAYYNGLLLFFFDQKNKGMRGSCGGIGFPDLVMHERDEMNIVLGVNDKNHKQRIGV